MSASIVGADFSIVPKLSFRGWLPTVTGQLSFSVFGRTTNPRKAIFENVADGECRHLVVTQIRKTGDAILPSPRIESKFLFVLVARTDPSENQSALSGAAFVIRAQEWDETNQKIDLFKGCLREAREQITSGATHTLSSHVKKPAQELIDFLDTAAAFKVNVRLSRSGTTDIKYDPRISPPTSPQFPSAELQRNRMLRAICAQFFFFLKDIGHRHQHHHPKTDTITDIYPLRGGDEDVEWRSSTLYNLYRKVIEYKRSPDRNNFDDCLGLLAYAQSFKRICERELAKEKFDKLPEYYADEISKSVMATQSKIERQIEEKRYYEDTRRNILIAVFGMIIAYIGLMQFSPPKISSSETNPFLIKILGVLLTDPGKCFSAFLFFAFIDVIGQVRRSVVELEALILRLFAAAPRWLVAATITLIFIFGLCILYLQSKQFF